MADEQPLRREVVSPISRHVMVGGLLICFLCGGIALFTLAMKRTSHEASAVNESAEAKAERRRVVKEEMERHRTKRPGAYVPLSPQPRRGDGSSLGRVRTIKALTRVDGPLEKTAVLAVLEENMHQVEECYLWALVLKLEYFGKLEYEWQIQRDGRVDALRKTGDTLGDVDVATCVADALRSLRFPEPDGTVTVQCPLMFQRAY